jgi:iron complex transport system substrate-binding protein
VRTCLSFTFAGLLIALGAPAFALTLTDDSGAELRLDRPAQRVISLSPHLTEMMYAVGAGELLVGVVRGSDFPVSASALREIGDAAGLDFERILALRADLVLAWGSGNRSIDIARLRSLGLNVLVLEPRQPEDISRHLELLGDATGMRTQAHSIATKFEVRLRSLRQRHAGRASVRVLFEIWHRPLFTVNGEHIISQVLGLCEAQNIFAHLPRLASEVSLEQVLLLDPDAIVVGSEAGDARVENWQEFAYLKAVRNGNVFPVSADLITRQTPRFIEAAEGLCDGLDKARR